MTEICQEFSDMIKEYFTNNTPRKIIETGSYKGMGSTKLIASLLKNLRITDSKFYSIECNKEFIDEAHKNLSDRGVIDHVTLMHGLSIPREGIPSEIDLAEYLTGLDKVPNLKKDHSSNMSEACFLYSKEVQTKGQEDLLFYIIHRGGFNPDFVLLDSSGHLGFTEFNYLMDLLTYPCAIALDDTNHVKHYKSKSLILGSNKFKILHESNSHTGSLIALYTP